MRIHSFHHAPYEGLSAIDNWIKEKNHAHTFTNFYDKYSLPQRDSFDLLIIMGGPMSVYETDKYTWLEEEKNFIRKAIESNKKVLGICLGSQLIASALGAAVYPNRLKEIGWFPITVTLQAKNYSLFDHLDKEQIVFHWHGDTFDLPDGAVHIAESKECKNQAFIYKDNVIGLQFHLEFTENSLKELIANSRGDLIKSSYVQTEIEILKNLHLLNSLNIIMYRLLDNWF